jgi:hypothetical protein
MWFAVVKGEPGLESITVRDRLRTWHPERISLDGRFGAADERL